MSESSSFAKVPTRNFITLDSGSASQSVTKRISPT